MIEFSGTLNASLLPDSRQLSGPYGLFQLPITLDVVYSFEPSDFRTNSGAFGGFSFSFSAPEKSFGIVVQTSNPSSLFISVYTNYQDAPPDVTVLRTDYSTTWPDGTPAIRVVVGSDYVPHVYFDGVEAVLFPGGTTPDYQILGGNSSEISAIADVPDRFVTFQSLRFAP